MRTDNAGCVPKVGDYVAYNMSGQIATGYILSVGKSRLAPIYRIERVLPERPHMHPTSTVRGGPQCLLVLSTNVVERRGVLDAENRPRR